MQAFGYHRPKSVGEAQALLKSVPGAKLLAGGQSLIPMMKLRLNRPECLIDLGGIASLASITREENSLLIGALARHAAIAVSPDVAALIPGLVGLASGIGDPQVRNLGTIGGSLANNDPAADWPAGVLALNATLRTNKRTIMADQFFAGLFATALAEDEILTSIEFEVPRRFAYAKFPNPASRFALVGVAVAQLASGVRVAVTGAGSDGVFRLTSMETALSKSFTPEAFSNAKIDAAGLTRDLHADADYRAHLIAVMAERAVRKA